MMDAYVTEEQQVEAIKRWFNRYGNLLTWLIIAILATILAVKYWLHHQEVVFQQASNQYTILLEALEKNDPETIKTQAANLLEKHPKSPYATFASFVLANTEIQGQQYDDAAKHLEWAMNEGKQADFKALARIRLMRLLIAQDKLSDALALFDEGKARGYLPIMMELKGDILYKQNDQTGALKAYEQALRAAPKEQMSGFLLKLKLEELGLDPKSINEQETKAMKS